MQTYAILHVFCETVPVSLCTAQVLGIDLIGAVRDRPSVGYTQCILPSPCPAHPSLPTTGATN